MLEDSKMDKKSINRSTQPQSRASAVDCKKNSDTTHKPWPRSNKKREGTGAAPKNDQYRKNGPPQRGRGQMDRRPRPRGSGNFTLGGAENTGIAEDEPELGSVFVPGSKKQNLNHLLNFMYTPRSAPDQRGPQSRRHVPKRSVNVHPHNHELYLQACCQFVVKEDGDYKANLLDPDIPVPWDQIEEIVVRGTGKSECPICLGAPVAGRVGRCGHVHCWPCALHYTAAHDKQPPPCPVCAAPFKVDMMKPARMVQWDSPSEEVTMRLVRRLRGSTVVEIAPIRGDYTDTVSEIQMLKNINDAPYSKMFSASKQQVQEILYRERNELKNQILAEIDTTEVVFMEQALDMLKKKEEYLNTSPVVPSNTGNTKPDNVPTIYEKQVINTNKIDWFDVDEKTNEATGLQNDNELVAAQNKLEELDLESNLNPEAAEFALNPNDDHNEEFPLVEDAVCVDDEENISNNNAMTFIDKENQSKYFYFYQAKDGQQIFLNSLNVRLLNASWGALVAAPNLIKGRVLHRETFSLVEQTRKHMPYAAHLPLYCPFDIVELDLKPPYVTPAALQNYADELDRRARVRARSEREERRRERAYRRLVEGPPRPDFSSELSFPPTSPPKYQPVEVSVEEVQVAPSGSGLSFAKMASTSGTWRVRPTRPATPPPCPDDEEVSAPRALNLSDAIEAALHAGPASTGGKKKKNKQKLLFATGLQHAA